MSPQPTLSNHTPLLIGITGGIGSGKSVVSHILRIAGLPVYDTDSEAKHIMDSPAVKQQISDTWGPELYLVDGSLDRRRLAAIVFNDPSQLARLNALVHPAVRNDFASRAAQSTSPLFFVESAILQSAGMDGGLQYVWLVTADPETRIERVMRRNGISRNEVISRIESQTPYRPDDRTRTIVNDGRKAVLPQIIGLLAEIGITL